MRTTVRATRSYMAGVGTSGSLLAGAALLFVLGSAIVAFRGWPQIATGPATTSVTAAAQPTATSHTTRRLAALLGRSRAILAGTAAASAPRGRPRAPGRPGSGGVVGAAGSGSRPSVGSAPAIGSAASVAGSGVGSGPCGGNCRTPQSAVAHLTDTVARQVTNIGSEVGSQLGSGTTTVAAPVTTVNAPAGNLAQGAGSKAANAVPGTATAAGNVVTQAGNALGGGH